MELTRTTTSKKLSMIDQLKVEAKHSKALNAVCHIFAIRERARQQVTLAALKQTMSKEGFDFSVGEYEGVLSALAKAGVGTLMRDSKRRPKSITNIKYTLQSIGQAVVQDNAEEPKRFNPRNRYQAVSEVTHETPQVPPTPPPRAVTEAPTGASSSVPMQKVVNVALSAVINDMPVVFVIADEMEPSQLGQLLMRLGKTNLPSLT